jgi:hypothetical protein
MGDPRGLPLELPDSPARPLKLPLPGSMGVLDDSRGTGSASGIGGPALPAAGRFCQQRNSLLADGPSPVAARSPAGDRGGREAGASSAVAHAGDRRGVRAEDRRGRIASGDLREACDTSDRAPGVGGATGIPTPATRTELVARLSDMGHGKAIKQSTDDLTAGLRMRRHRDGGGDRARGRGEKRSRCEMLHDEFGRGGKAARGVGADEMSCRPHVGQRGLSACNEFGGGDADACVGDAVAVGGTTSGCTAEGVTLPATVPSAATAVDVAQPAEFPLVTSSAVPVRRRIRGKQSGLAVDARAEHARTTFVPSETVSRPPD